MSGMIILKLGGSLITDKSAEVPTHRFGVIQRLTREIYEADNIPKVINNGAGSYGHPLAKKYERGELKTAKPIQYSVAKLNNKVKRCLDGVGFETEVLVPHELCKYYIDIFHKGNFDLRRLLNRGEEIIARTKIALSYGDMIYSSVGKHVVLSADTITAEQAIEYEADMVVMATDVDGVFTKDPKKYRDAKFIPRIGADEDLSYILEPEETDASGGMLAKLKELQKVAGYGIRCYVIDGLVPGNLRKILSGEKILCTSILP